MGPTAAAAILCGDPARALAIAQHVLVEPRMSNHHRGLWGYHGQTQAGAELSVQTTGIGGPSAALVLDLMARRGLRAAIRVGSCRSATARPALGSRVAVTGVIARDGASRAYGTEAGARLVPDGELTESLLGSCEAQAELASLDQPGPAGDPLDEGSSLYDLQSAALLAVGRVHRLRIGIGAVVSRNQRGPLPDEPLEAAALRLAADAAASLAGS